MTAGIGEAYNRDTDNMWVAAGIIAAAAVLASAFFAFMRQQRSKGARIVVEKPGTPGGQLRGTIFTGVRSVPSEVRLHLWCVHSIALDSVPFQVDERADGGVNISIGRADNPSALVYEDGKDSITDIVWEQKQVLPRTKIGGAPSGFTIPFRFELPHDAQVTSQKGTHSYDWVLEAVADVPGIDFKATFPIEVRRL